jgi:hypothetical protein
MYRRINHAENVIPSVPAHKTGFYKVEDQTALNTVAGTTNS